MRRLGRGLIALWMLLCGAWLAGAHPAPFSYLDVHVDGDRLSGRLVLHDPDVAHELGLDDPDVLRDADTVRRHQDAIATLVTMRLAIEVDGRPITWVFDAVAPVAADDAVALEWHAAETFQPGRLVIGARLFPYDPTHQTFVTVYAHGEVATQDVLGYGRDRTTHEMGGERGAWDVFARFFPSGIHHIAIGPDHILFLIGLLLPGGRVARLLAIVTAFTVGHSITLVLATLGWLNPSADVIEPLIALSIVFVGADNLLAGPRTRDLRPWVAIGFGLIHGFGFANVLREMTLPPRALGVSLFAFNLGVEAGQAAIVVVVASLLAWLRRAHQPMAGHVRVGGSWVVLVAGAWWFAERVGIF